MSEWLYIASVIWALIVFVLMLVFVLMFVFKILADD